MGKYLFVIVGLIIGIQNAFAGDFASCKKDSECKLVLDECRFLVAINHNKEDLYRLDQKESTKGILYSCDESKESIKDFNVKCLSNKCIKVPRTK